MATMIENAGENILHVETVESEGTEPEIEEEESEDTFFQDIYLLAEHGINIADIEQLRKMGINTIKGFQMYTNPQLVKMTGFEINKILKIKEKAEQISQNNCFKTALELCEERKQIFKITTGSANLDKLLGGGIESMSVTQVFGEAGAGKTQMVHTLCVTAQIPTEDYSGGKVLFIDTEHTFRPERIRHIARRYNLKENGVLDNILYARAYNSEHQYELLKSVRKRFHEELGMFKLLIIDSIMALFKTDFSGRSELVNRQQKLTQMMSHLQKISEEYNVAVFITNHITSDMKGNLLDAALGDDGKPIGGNILAHSSTTRVALKKVNGKVRIAKLYDSPELEEREEAFIITKGGIDDPQTSQ